LICGVTSIIIAACRATKIGNIINLENGITYS
jgi:hypothetical protein